MPEASAQSISPQPKGATGVLVLDDGTVYWGKGLGATGTKTGEVVFNTSSTGYQEVLTDLSYAAQIVTFTFPHIGNVGTNPEDMESTTPAARGCVLRVDITDPANWRATQHLNKWLKKYDFVGLAGIDTRQLTAHIRDHGAPNGVVAHAEDGQFDIEALRTEATAWPGLEGMDLAKEATCRQTYTWSETRWTLADGFGDLERDGRSAEHHIVAVDFGAKRNILRCLADTGCKVTVVPATTTAEDIFSHNPDGIFLSNGPGDPAATGAYATPVVRDLLAADKPIFGICLGHQILALALGAKTYKLQLGHRGGNQPVKDLETGKVEITSQNHGFCVDRESLPAGVIETHRSLFDGVVEGLRVSDKPVFSVQYHPEASPGPQDSHYLFDRFIELISASKSRQGKSA
ncbi:MAG: glutamine-hydrolyzing carbamoyl-phosphate synthase small subunit [Rhodospirillaceae bacterium]|jgi:carbamoyl-phosphate synthase small subunit|nr:glutamine-hydrolyzing carbamoyl-phosphate synthase small subunit [Rhodospirillaceae bacterium]